ncbi:MAG: hypothetical protein F2694_01725 [Actinobacteria bacterium]|uniref:Unannotated protein n=1 Tax=freshwater metagenome TaxID=449393 RepID=A0A6J6S9R3_9ZZZZ|nr:hypothetical protein [Actinomycetota bacterium]
METALDSPVVANAKVSPPSSVSDRIVGHIDRHHPRLGSFLLKLRWGGVRTFEPTPVLGAAVLGAGTSAGLGLSCALGRWQNGRFRVPLALAAPGGTVALWIAVWRWDAARWRRRHISMVLDLTPERLSDLVEKLRNQGLSVERWVGERSAGGSKFGISCRARDLRKVNAAIGQIYTESFVRPPRPA